MKSKIITLTSEQTLELRQLWACVKDTVEVNKYQTAQLWLARREARLTRNQAYLICINLARSSDQTLPDWVLDMVGGVTT